MLTICLVIFLYITHLLIIKALDGVVKIEDILFCFIYSILIVPSITLILLGLFGLYQQYKDKRVL